MNEIANMISGVTMKTREEVETAVNKAVDDAKGAKYALEDMKGEVTGEKHAEIEASVSEQDVTEQVSKIQASNIAISKAKESQAESSEPSGPDI